MAPWIPQDPTEAQLDGLEEYYVMSLINKATYTKEQMLDKALVATQFSGLFIEAIKDWHALVNVAQTWMEFK